MAEYVDIDAIPLTFLEFLGYYLVSEDEEFQVFVNKGEVFAVSKSPPKLLYVDDRNDAQTLRAHNRKPSVPAPLRHSSQ